jgi:hypothetical protein
MKMGREIFANSPNVVIYCEFNEAQFNWDINWNSSNNTVYWNGEWEYDGNGIPTPINQ